MQVRYRIRFSNEEILEGETSEDNFNTYKKYYNEGYNRIFLFNEFYTDDRIPVISITFFDTERKWVFAVGG